jgi:hypothetical protein
MMRRFLLVAAAALVAGCAGSPFGGYNVAPGTTRDAVIARMGPPQRVFRLPNGGERLEYSQQPWGQQAYMVDLDGSGRVLGMQQVLNEPNFQRIVPGQWTRADIEREFGRPAKIDRVTSWPGPVWTYRWKDRVNTDMFYWVYLDANNVVQRAHPGIDVINAPDPKV